MPLIRVTYLDEAISDAAREGLAEGLTNVLLDIEGGRETAGGRALAYVVFMPVRRGHWYVGGKSGLEHQRGPERIIVDVTVPEGATTTAHKTDIHMRVHGVLSDILGWSADEGNINAWVIVHEVPEGSWGAEGKTFGLMRIAEYAGDPGAVPDLERMNFIRTYFTAKGRSYAAAGYPDLTSGLMRMSTSFEWPNDLRTR